MSLAEPEAADGETEASPGAPEARPRGKGGRPKGAKNKIGRDVKQLIAEHGHEAVGMMVKIIRGHVFYAGRQDGKRVKQHPDLTLRYAAARTLLDRVAPTLKSSEVASTINAEVSGPGGEPLAEPTPGAVAKVLLNMLGPPQPHSDSPAGDSAPGLSDTGEDAEAAVEPTSSISEASAALFHRLNTDVSPAVLPATEQPADVSRYVEAVPRQRGYWVVTAGGARLEWRGTREQAEGRAREMLAAGQLPGKDRACRQP